MHVSRPARHPLSLAPVPPLIATPSRALGFIERLAAPPPNDLRHDEWIALLQAGPFAFRAFDWLEQAAFFYICGDTFRVLGN